MLLDGFFLTSALLAPGPWFEFHGLLGSMGKVASSVDNALIDSFWSTMQRELLDRQSWDSRTELAAAIFEWFEG